jgi:hypothetical protein
MFIRKSQKINYQNIKDKEFVIEQSTDKYFKMLEARAKLPTPAKITSEQIEAATKSFLDHGGHIKRIKQSYPAPSRSALTITSRRTDRALQTA